MLKRISSDALPPRAAAVDAPTLAQAGQIVDAVAAEGVAAVRRHAERLGDLAPGAPLVLGPEALAAAWASLSETQRGVLDRTARRIEAFAAAQMAGLTPVEVPIPGGRTGLRYQPVDRAGCYAPGGRFPLPSSVLMTAVTARAAGVAEVWVASPRPAVETLAAAHRAGAAGVLAVGGAQAIAAFAYGAGVPRCAAIVGPGNAWVTAAKKLVSGDVAIDMLAGPSELLVLADGTADPDRVAADLLAQAEHDPLAVPMLVGLDLDLDAVDEALSRQLETLPTAGIARQSLARGFAVRAADADEAVALSDALAPEHLALHGPAAEALAARLDHYGALFVGEGAAEVLGDYGAGPNHTLPTGGSARSTGALSVLSFLRVQTWMRLDAPAEAQELVADCVALARMEGLEAHARAAELRQGGAA